MSIASTIAGLGKTAAGKAGYVRSAKHALIKKQMPRGAGRAYGQSVKVGPMPTNFRKMGNLMTGNSAGVPRRKGSLMGGPAGIPGASARRGGSLMGGPAGVPRGLPTWTPPSRPMGSMMGGPAGIPRANPAAGPLPKRPGGSKLPRRNPLPRRPGGAKQAQARMGYRPTPMKPGQKYKTPTNRSFKMPGKGTNGRKAIYAGAGVGAAGSLAYAVTQSSGKAVTATGYDQSRGNRMY